MAQDWLSDSMLLSIGGSAVLLAAILYMGYCGAMPLRRLWRLRTWKPGTATVLRAGHVEIQVGEGSVWYRPAVAYRYEVDGKSYESTQLGVVKNAFDEQSERRFRAFMDAVSQGQTIAIRYDPEDPSRAVMNPGCTVFRRNHYITLIVAAVLLFALLAAAFYFTA